MMQWHHLLSPTRRFHPEKGNRPRQVRSPFEQDADRIQFSPDFRRLQDKTQVYPSPDDDSAHSRLTHSLEVASVARSLGREIGSRLWKEGDPRIRSLSEVALAASLLHDIGNPPFGHAGEKVIQEYFQEIDTPQLSSELYRDLRRFDGNPQALRVVMTLGHQADGGLHLTDAVLAASVKYPWRAVSSGAKKFGVFASEADRYYAVAKAAGLSSRVTPEGPWLRHPCAWIVEAADDICNNLLDLEDAFRLELLNALSPPGMEVFKTLEDLARQGRFKESRYAAIGARGKNERLGYLRSLAIGVGIQECVEIFMDQRDSILSGGAQVAPLIEQAPSWPRFKALKECVHTHCFALDEVVLRELAGEQAIRTLLEVFVPAAISNMEIDGRKQRRKLASRYLGRTIRLNDADDQEERVRMVLDFIVGMTDRFALKLAREVRGY